MYDKRQSFRRDYMQAVAKHGGRLVATMATETCEERQELANDPLSWYFLKS